MSVQSVCVTAVVGAMCVVVAQWFMGEVHSEKAAEHLDRNRTKYVQQGVDTMCFRGITYMEFRADRYSSWIVQWGADSKVIPCKVQDEAVVH